MGYCAPEAQANSHLNTARSWRDDEIRFWVPSRHCSISADITGDQQETNGRQGTVASKTINIAKINPELTVKPEAPLTVKIENLLAVSHFKHQICKQLHYARDFETTALESAKRMTQWSSFYFTHPTSYYPVPSTQIHFQDFPRMTQQNLPVMSSAH